MISFPIQKIHTYHINKSSNNFNLKNTDENNTDEICFCDLNQKELFAALKQYDFAIK